MNSLEDIKRMFADEATLRLMKELRPKNGEQARLDEILTYCRERFPLNAEVVVLGTSYTGKISGYNTRTGGFYPGERYPIYITIESTSNTRFDDAVGCTFEYGYEQIAVVVRHGEKVEVFYPDGYVRVFYSAPEKNYPVHSVKTTEEIFRVFIDYLSDPKQLKEAFPDDVELEVGSKTELSRNPERVTNP